MSTSAKILDRIEKLLRMAADCSSPNEAAIAANRAQKLMEKYQISEADVVLDELKTGVGMGTENVTFGKQMPTYQNHLLVAVAKFHECEVVGTRVGSAKAATFRGYKYDVQAAVYTFKFLTSTIEKLCNSNWIEYKALGGSEHGKRWKDSFRKGAAAAVMETLRKLAKENNKTEVGTSLVIAKKNAIAQHYGQTRYKSGSSRATSSSYSRGYAQGKNVRVNKAITK